MTVPVGVVEVEEAKQGMASPTTCHEKSKRSLHTCMWTSFSRKREVCGNGNRREILKRLRAARHSGLSIGLNDGTDSPSMR